MPDTFDLRFPLTSGDDFQHTLATGNILFLLGANGTGKSSLVTKFYASNNTHAKRISAHRQTWFTSNSLDMTPSTRNNMEDNIRGQDTQERSRHIHQYASERTAMALFDLVDADTLLARKIAELVRAKALVEAEKQALIPAPLAVINQLMRSSNIPIEIAIEEGQKVVARKNGGKPYSVAELSDGERNAFLIAADVLTAKPGTLVLIDEPERHLHRSIISPLLTLLFQRRGDCAFIVSTHELMLPIDNPTAATLLIRSCEYAGSRATSWAADLLPAGTPLDEGLKADVLGGRQKMIFIEGRAQSLDAPLYSLLFPQVSIVPKSSCRDVEYAVRGLREAETKHWVKAWGIVDSDRRGTESIEKLKQFGIFALAHFSVEALYYNPWIIQKMADRMATITGKEAAVLFENAIEGAIAEAARQRDHLVLDAVERLTRRAIFDALPTKADVRSNPSVKIEIEVAALKASEEADFDRFIITKDLNAILERYPIRESGALARIASDVGLKNRGDYEHAVRTMLQQDVEAMAYLRGLFRELVAEVSLSEVSAPASVPLAALSA
jgi:ABC-type cobalamin/Fe3+-siderophores transport system ATPase subunit